LPILVAPFVARHFIRALSGGRVVDLCHTLRVLHSGTRLGRYEVRSPLGAGGMGEVYLAQDTQLDRKVALKILPGDVAADPDRLERFVREAKAASGLNHPNIITIHEIDTTASTPFIATEFIDGSTLRERMRARSLPVAQALDIAVQIAGALAAAHASGIVHRDIKPENVMLRGDGIAKVLDFGLAKLARCDAAAWVNTRAQTQVHFKTDSGVVLGTATYMSPEQARGDEVDARTDIFSLGLVIYEMVTGSLPFQGANSYEVVAGILSDREAPPLSSQARDVPAELERIAGKALRKNRDERYQSIKDLVLDLQSLKQRLAFERTHPRVLPARRAPLVAVGVLVLIGAAVGYAWWTQTHALSEPEIKSLAVLPLKSLAADDNYLGMGIADAAIRRVSQTGRVIVRPTSAVRRYLTEDIDALAAAQQLKVDSVLEGSFQRSGDRLRVNVNLLRTRDGASLWADSFDIGTADIFTVQDTVAQQVASRLRLRLDASQKTQLTKRYTSNPDAYEFYLKGMYNFDQRLRDPAGMLGLAITFYEKAIAADPNFALAHAQLAVAFATQAVFLDPTRPMLVERAKEEIARAEALDPNLADTHLARFQLMYSEFEGYQVEAASREVLQAIRLNPNVGHHELAYMYNHMGLEDLAVRELSRELEIDPTSDGPSGTAVLMYEVQSRYDEYAADRSIRHEDRMDAMSLLSAGRFAEAQKLIDAWSKRSRTNGLVMAQAMLFALKGDFAAAEAQIPIALRQHPLKDPLYHHDTYDIACVYAMEGKSAEAVKWLRESAVSGYHLYPRYQRDAFLSRIRQSPEFIRFLAEMKAENGRYRKEFS
jgi:TolB-like protein